MKIKTVRVVPEGRDGCNFSITVSHESDDKYVDEIRKPNAMGLYHFNSEKYTDKEASSDLISCMISTHDKEILRLNKSKDALEKLRRGLTHGRT